MNTRIAHGDGIRSLLLRALTIPRSGGEVFERAIGIPNPEIPSTRGATQRGQVIAKRRDHRREIRRHRNLSDEHDGIRLSQAWTRGDDQHQEREDSEREQHTLDHQAAFES